MNRRYDSARYMFYVADDELRGKHDLYELNNLLWFMKVYYWYGRWYRLPRAIWLALRTGYHRRALEALLIAASAPTCTSEYCAPSAAAITPRHLRTSS